MHVYFISNEVYIYFYQHRHHSRLSKQLLNTCQTGWNTVQALVKLVGMFGNCLNISIYLCQTICIVCIRSSSLPAFQRCLCHPNWLSGCRVIHVVVSVQTVCHCLATVQTLVQSVQTFQYICAGLFALCVSSSP